MGAQRRDALSGSNCAREAAWIEDQGDSRQLRMCQRVLQLSQLAEQQLSQAINQLDFATPPEENYPDCDSQESDAGATGPPPSVRNLRSVLNQTDKTFATAPSRSSDRRTNRDMRRTIQAQSFSLLDDLIMHLASFSEDSLKHLKEAGDLRRFDTFESVCQKKLRTSIDALHREVQSATGSKQRTVEPEADSAASTGISFQADFKRSVRFNEELHNLANSTYNISHFFQNTTAAQSKRVNVSRGNKSVATVSVTDLSSRCDRLGHLSLLWYARTLARAAREFGVFAAYCLAEEILNSPDLVKTFNAEGAAESAQLRTLSSIVFQSENCELDVPPDADTFVLVVCRSSVQAMFAFSFLTKLIVEDSERFIPEMVLKLEELAQADLCSTEIKRHVVMATAQQLKATSLSSSLLDGRTETVYAMGMHAASDQALLRKWSAQLKASVMVILPPVFPKLFSDPSTGVPAHVTGGTKLQVEISEQMHSLNFLPFFALRKQWLSFETNENTVVDVMCSPTTAIFILDAQTELEKWQQEEAEDKKVSNKYTSKDVSTLASRVATGPMLAASLCFKQLYVLFFVRESEALRSRSTFLLQAQVAALHSQIAGVEGSKFELVIGEQLLQRRVHEIIVEAAQSCNAIASSTVNLESLNPLQQMRYRFFSKFPLGCNRMLALQLARCDDVAALLRAHSLSDLPSDIAELMSQRMANEFVSFCGENFS
ncbi:MAG: hypothetical protein MHM6MM_004222 [Cercozoa sp. M6MM]